MKTITLGLLIACAGLAQAEDKLFDDKLATNAVAVLRVQGLDAQPVRECPFICYTVKPQRIYKNASNQRLDYTMYERINYTMHVYGFSNKAGVPAGVSTIHIAKYDVPNARFDQTNGKIWMLIGGGGTNAISHVIRDADFR
jgi:hypothetical protein